MKKRILSIILTICMIMSAFAAMSVTASAAASGECGDDLTWTFNHDDGTLTISGTGDMWDNDYLSPWYIFCKSILSIIIEDGVTSIGDSVFYNCSSLTSITIPDSVISIGVGAFSECSSLTNITIPDSVTSISYDSFYKCNSLSDINVNRNNPKYSSINGNLYNKNCSLLIQYAIGKKDTLFNIPDSVTSISYMAFYDCRSLKNINISDNIISIGDLAFFGCSSLTDITIPYNVISIGEMAFSSCNSLSTITISGNVNFICYHAFKYCNNLTDVYYLSNKENWDKIYIGSSNEDLLSANIHYLSFNGKISTAEYDGTKVSGTVNFDYSDEKYTSYLNVILYLALFDNSGRLEKFVKYDVPKGLKSQDFEIPVADANGHSIKAMFWNGNYAPLGISDEVTIK